MKIQSIFCAMQDQADLYHACPFSWGAHTGRAGWPSCTAGGRWTAYRLRPESSGRYMWWPSKARQPAKWINGGSIIITHFRKYLVVHICIFFFFTFQGKYCCTCHCFLGSFNPWMYWALRSTAWVFTFTLETHSRSEAQWDRKKN